MIINSIAGQAGELSQQVVAGFRQLEQWLMNSPLPIDQSWFQLDEWGTRIQQFLVDSQSTIAAYAGDIGTSIGHFLAGVAICLFTLFYFLYDGRGIFSFLLNLMPRAAQARADAAALRGWQSLSAYVRATVLVALVDAIGVLIVALALRVPLAPALAALVFLGAFIPLVGAFVSGFLAVLVALVAVGWVQALIMLAGIIVVMQVEGHILQPFLLGRAVHLHPARGAARHRHRHRDRRHRRRPAGRTDPGLREDLHPGALPAVARGGRRRPIHRRRQTAEPAGA